MFLHFVSWFSPKKRYIPSKQLSISMKTLLKKWASFEIPLKAVKQKIEKQMKNLKSFLESPSYQSSLKSPQTRIKHIITTQKLPILCQNISKSNY